MLKPQNLLVSVNLRPGPGVNYTPVIRNVSRDTQLIPLSRNSDGSWLEVSVQGGAERGWVSAGSQFLRCTGDIKRLPIGNIPPAPQQRPAAPSDNTTTTEQPASAVAPPCLIYDFENGRGWARGDQSWGTFTIAPEQVYSGKGAGKFDYAIPAGVADNYFVYRRTDAGFTIPCQPNALSAQVYGDGSGNFLNAWVDDAKGTRWQFTFGRITHTGWQGLTARLDPGLGWPNVAINNSSATEVTPPLRFFAFVVDGAEDRAYRGVIYVDDLYAASASASPTTDKTTVESASNPPAVESVNVSCSANPTKIKLGDTVRLSWNITNVREVYLDGRGVAGVGSRDVQPSETRTYRLRIITRDGAEQSCDMTIEVEQSSRPSSSEPSVSFYADQSAIGRGECTELVWSVSGVREIYL